MNLFTEKEISKILENVDVATIKMVATVLGKDFLTREDLDLLKKKGVDLIKLLPKFPTHYQSFLFGRLSASLGHEVVSKMSYPEFTKFLANMGLFEPNTDDMIFYRISANKSYSHIKTFSQRIKDAVLGHISEAEMVYAQNEKLAKADKVIREKITSGILKKESIKRVTSNIAHQMEVWNADWGRIVETESQDIYNTGKVQMMSKDGSDPLVYFDVFHGACRHCIRLHLTRGVGSKPKVYRLSTLIANGSNYGRKSSEYKATIHPVHPHCRCDIRELPEGYEWNTENKEFSPKKNLERKVSRTGKAKISIGDKEYIV